MIKLKNTCLFGFMPDKTRSSRGPTRFTAARLLEPGGNRPLRCGGAGRLGVPPASGLLMPGNFENDEHGCLAGPIDIEPDGVVLFLPRHLADGARIQLDAFGGAFRAGIL